MNNLMQAVKLRSLCECLHCGSDLKRTEIVWEDVPSGELAQIARTVTECTGCDYKLIYEYDGRDKHMEVVREGMRFRQRVD